MAALYSGGRPWPTSEELDALTRDALDRRRGSHTTGRRQFPRDYSEHAAELATALGVPPPPRHPGSWALVPALFRLRHPPMRRGGTLAELGTGLLRRWLRTWLARLLLLEAHMSKSPPKAGKALQWSAWRLSRWTVRGLAWAGGLA